MARRVYFAFHYQRDIWRVNVVRNSWVGRDREACGFYDASLWEKAKTEGKEALKRLINKGFENTSVTAVLIGAETYSREWVLYEIKQSYNRGNGLLGVYIHNIENSQGLVDYPGKNPFDYVYVDKDGVRTYFSSMYPTYDWVWNDGYNNFGTWVEEAAQAAGR